MEFEEFKQELQEKKAAEGTPEADIHIVPLPDFKKSQPFVVGDNSEAALPHRISQKWLPKEDEPDNMAICMVSQKTRKKEEDACEKNRQAYKKKSAWRPDIKITFIKGQELPHQKVIGPTLPIRR